MPAPRISAFTLWFFRRIVHGYFRRHFTAVRLSGAEHFVHDGTPLIVYANHSSWWDPMVCVQLGASRMPERKHFAPMDAESLDRYAILKRIGIFPVAQNTARGAVQFLRTGEAVLNEGGVLWVTPQGRFVDSRQRPLDFKPGLTALARRVADHADRCTVLPLAIEYLHWNERLPETLLHFGEPVRLTANGPAAAQVEATLVAALEATMAELQHLAERRDPAPFTTLLGGSTGAGGFYALGKRLKALVQRQPYRPEHTLLPPDLARELRD
jgi:1-acyl-sn-glycerol-3-phosphate acyltransferase